MGFNFHPKRMVGITRECKNRRGWCRRLSARPEAARTPWHCRPQPMIPGWQPYCRRTWTRDLRVPCSGPRGCLSPAGGRRTGRGRSRRRSWGRPGRRTRTPPRTDGAGSRRVGGWGSWPPSRTRRGCRRPSRRTPARGLPGVLPATTGSPWLHSTTSSSQCFSWLWWSSLLDSLTSAVLYFTRTRGTNACTR